MERSVKAARGKKVSQTDAVPEVDLTQAFEMLDGVEEFVEDEDFSQASAVEIETQLDMLERAFTEFTDAKQGGVARGRYVALRNRLREKAVRDNQGGVQVVSADKVSLPHFSGKYDKWTKFEAAFRIDVHDKNTSDQVKLRKLLKCLSGEPWQLLQKFDLLEKNAYKEAWQMLKENFHNSYEAFTAHVKVIFSQKKVSRGSARQARETVSDTQAGVEKALRILERGDGHGLSCAAAVNLLARMDAKTREQWRMVHGKTNMPDLKHVCEFILDKAKTWAEEDGRSSRKRSRSPVENVRSQSSAYTKISRQPREAKRSKRSSCYRCEGDHRLPNCKVFAQDTSDKQRALLERQSLCNRCIGRHSGRDCSRKCSKCDGLHHELFCAKVRSK